MTLYIEVPVDSLNELLKDLDQRFLMADKSHREETERKDNNLPYDVKERAKRWGQVVAYGHASKELRKRMESIKPISFASLLQEKLAGLTEEKINQMSLEYLKAVGSHDKPDITRHDFTAGIADLKKMMEEEG